MEFIISADSDMKIFNFKTVSLFFLKIRIPFSFGIGIEIYTRF